MVAAITFAAGCRDAPEDGSDVPGVAQGPNAPESLVRLDMMQSAGAVTVDGMSRVSVVSSRAPMPSLGGSHMAVAYSGDKVVSAVPVRFPKSLHIDGATADGGPEEHDEPLKTSSVSVFVSAMADRVEVLDTNDVVVASVTKEQLSASTAGARSTGVQPRTVKSATVPPVLGQPQWAHIRFLTPADSLPKDFLDEGWQGDLDLDVDLADALAKTLAEVPPAALAAITTIGIATTTPANVNAGTSGGTIIIGKAAVLNNRTTLPHESAHAFANLVDDPLSEDDAAKWSPEVRAKGAELNARFATAGGLTSAWAALQQNGVELGLAGEYAGSGWGTLGYSGATSRGFAYDYGGSSAAEDIATYVETLQTHRIAQHKDGDLFACEPIRSSTTDFPVAYAIPYAKIKLLESVGLLDKEKVSACIGTPPVESDGAPKGISFYDGVGSPVFQLDVSKAGWSDADGATFLTVVGQNASYDVLVRVLAPNKVAPLGVHRLDSIGLFNINAPNNAIYVANKSSVDRNRASGGGLVLVTRVDAKRVQGVFFFVSLKNAAFVTDRFAFGTFRFDT